jgi:hypothetical protein
LDDLAKKLTAADIDQASVKRAVAALCRIDERQPLDFDSARQIAWALKILSADVAGTRASSDLTAIFAAWEKSLLLSLPSQPSGSITAHFPARMEAQRTFDPSAFRRELARVGAVQF